MTDIEKLKSRVVMGHLPTGKTTVTMGDFKIIAAGPLTKQPGTMGFRIVMGIVEDTQIVVWNEIFPNCKEGGELGDFVNSYFNSGDYFPLTEMDKATAKFAKRISETSESFLSLYR